MDDIKDKTDYWEPYSPEENPLKDLTQPELYGLLGTIKKPPVGGMEPVMENADVPDDFDARVYFKDCVHPIRDQEKCGSCWAFSASEAMSDRLCIASSGKIDVILSPEKILECDASDMGCNGGELENVWSFLENVGTTPDTCDPYTSGSGTVPKCSHKSQCADSSATYTNFKCAKGSVVEATTAEQIKNNLYVHGPMQTGFQVYSDFFNYKSGVYHYVSGRLEGGHAVKILGWGSQDGMDYWLCGNSWGTKWGEAGYFKIAVGECQIDESVWACIPETNESFMTLIE